MSMDKYERLEKVGEGTYGVVVRSAVPGRAERVVPLKK